jgi:hypothetical protein
VLVTVLVLVTVAFCAAPAEAGGRRHRGESACENVKLEAAEDYFQCLITAARRANRRGAEISDHAIDICDARFENDIERAELEFACTTPGGASALGGPIKAEALETARRMTSAFGCDTIKEGPDQTVTCTFSATKRTAFDFEAVLDDLGSYGVTGSTGFWLEAWGGDGSHGNTGNGGSAGKGGYAQTTSTVAYFKALYGSSVVYYYTGLPGRFQADAGGDGGTGTMVTVSDLAKETPTESATVLLAGGGGGGGAGRGKAVCTIPFRPGSFEVLGGGGGAGGVAIATLAHRGTGAGEKGGARRDRNYSGQGGTNTGQGGYINGVDGTAGNGLDGLAPLGAAGGRNSNPRIGFANGTTVVARGGGGGGLGDARLQAGGGGGGGGWGSGAGGAGAQDVSTTTNCVSGGGGGGASLAARSSTTCAAAPTSAPPNPNGDTGWVQITFDLGACGP